MIETARAARSWDARWTSLPHRVKAGDQLRRRDDGCSRAPHHLDDSGWNAIQIGDGIAGEYSIATRFPLISLASKDSSARQLLYFSLVHPEGHPAHGPCSIACVIATGEPLRGM